MRRRRRPGWEILGILMCIDSVSCCLSNPHLPCSVASSQSSCRSAHGAVTSFQHDIYATGQYQGFLGAGVQARAYSELRSESEFATTDEELTCTNVTTCTWHNDARDQLDWVTGFGSVAPAKLNVITGSTIMPGSNFFILASDTRPPTFAGSLISKAIACQPSSGLLSFRYWRSRARVAGQEPDLDVCTRRVPDSTLENCLTIESTPNHTILASIPPIFEPFEIVIRGYGFENEPEGGLIILDSIDYFAQLDSAENCAVREQNTIPPEAIVEPETLPPTPQPPSELARDEEKVHSSEVMPKSILIVPNDESENGCKSLECNLEEAKDEGCLYRRVGTGAKGEGYRVGWKVAHQSATPSNPLTGIHSPPDVASDPNFLVADFPGYAKSRKGHRYVLESPEFLLEDKTDAYLSFKKYMATQGIELLVCTDWRGLACFWDAFQNSADPFSRKWTKEVVKLPNNINKFFIISTQDETERANVGQIGLSSIRIYADSEATKPFC